MSSVLDYQLTNKVDTRPQSNDPRFGVSATIDLDSARLEDVTVKEVIVGESLLNPSAYTVTTLQSAMYFQTGFGSPIDWNRFRCKPIRINISDLLGNRTMKINQTVYRCDNRQFTSTNTGNTEDLSLHSIDQSILNDAGKVWKKVWKCATPSQVVREALQQIGGSDGAMVSNNTGPGRPYMAESIHPLQVIQQQANVALANGNDPSFIHYMTIDGNTGKNIHNFRSLYDLMHPSAHTPVDLYAGDVGVTGDLGFSDSFADLPNRTAISFNFPCDYDVLSDILNGISCEGANLNEVRMWNPTSGDFMGAASQVMGAVSSIANLRTSWTNKGTAQQQNSCETNVEKYLLKRQARMGLLERDKIALRIVLPWSPWFHPGHQIKFNWVNRYDQTIPQYGSGRYMIVNMTHKIQFGDYATTTLDCIANTFGVGG